MKTARRKIGPLTLDIPALIIGVQILAKGWEKLEAPGHHLVLASFLLILGAAVLVAAFLALWLEKRTASAHGLVHGAEGVAMGLSAIVMLGGGKLRIPLILLFSGLCYVILGFVESQPAERLARLARPLQRSFGCAFLAAGVLLAGYTAFDDRNIWAFVISGVLAAVGLTLLLLPVRFQPGAAHAGTAPEATAVSLQQR